MREDTQSDFALFSSDPLIQQRIRCASESKEGNSQNNSLQSLGLIPAALLRLKWLDPASCTTPYLRDHLLLKAADKDKGSDGASSSEYPAGIPLVLPSPPPTPAVAEVKEVEAEADTKKKGKPKWLKV